VTAAVHAEAAHTAWRHVDGVILYPLCVITFTILNWWSDVDDFLWNPHVYYISYILN
jgi:hypothetical protein